MAKQVDRADSIAGSRWVGDAGAPRGSRPRSARREHRSVCVAVQRSDERHARHHRAGRDHGLLGRTFEFIVKSPPAAILLKQAAGIPMEKKKGGEVINGEEKQKKSGKYKGFKVTTSQVRDIAQRKLQDLNARDLDHATRIIEGTARSLGLAVEA